MRDDAAIEATCARLRVGLGAIHDLYASWMRMPPWDVQTIIDAPPAIRDDLIALDAIITRLEAEAVRRDNAIFFASHPT